MHTPRIIHRFLLSHNFTYIHLNTGARGWWWPIAGWCWGGRRDNVFSCEKSGVFCVPHFGVIVLHLPAMLVVLQSVCVCAKPSAAPSSDTKIVGRL